MTSLRIEMNSIRITGFIAGLATLTATLVSADERLSDARDAVTQWVEVEKTLSREAADWRAKRAHLADLLSVAKQEIETLRAQIDDSRETATVGDKRRAELVARRDKLSGTAAAIAGFLKPAESRLRELKKRLPPPLQERLTPFYKRLPANSEETTLGLAERMQTVVGILSSIQKFDTAVTIDEAVRELSDGSSGEVRTIWFGLGAAYYISAGGVDAGIGIPTADGWEWKSQPQLAEAIQKVLQAADGQARETGFTPLPVKVAIVP